MKNQCACWRGRDKLALGRAAAPYLAGRRDEAAVREANRTARVPFEATGTGPEWNRSPQRQEQAHSLRLYSDTAGSSRAQRGAIARRSKQRHQCTLPVVTPVPSERAALLAARRRANVWPLVGGGVNERIDSSAMFAAASKRNAMRLKKCSLHERVSCRRLQQRCGGGELAEVRAARRHRPAPIASHRAQPTLMACRVARNRESSSRSAWEPGAPGQCCRSAAQRLALKYM